MLRGDRDLARSAPGNIYSQAPTTLAAKLLGLEAVAMKYAHGTNPLCRTVRFQAVIESLEPAGHPSNSSASPSTQSFPLPFLILQTEDGLAILLSE